MDPPSRQLRTAGLQTLDVDPPIDETAPSIDNVKAAVAKLKGGKAAGVCNISGKLLKVLWLASHLPIWVQYEATICCTDSTHLRSSLGVEFLQSSIEKYEVNGI